MSEKPKKKAVEEVILRSYPKVIFFWPLLITSLILYGIEAMDVGDINPALGYIWFMVFFANLFVIAFDFSSTKFFILIMVIVVIILVLIFLVVPYVTIDADKLQLDLGLPSGFYGVMTIILGLILIFVLITCQFNYWKVERNEIYHKSGIFSSAERIPTKSLRIKKEIPDVFEFFILRAGSITLMPGHGEVIHLSTVLNINNKQEQIDQLLSHVRVEIDDQS